MKGAPPLWVGILLVLIGAVLLFFVIRRFAVRRVLLRSGTRTHGEVVSATHTKNHRSFTASFVDGQGKTHLEVCSGSTLPVGRQVTVLYDPANPSRRIVEEAAMGILVSLVAGTTLAFFGGAIVAGHIYEALSGAV